LKRKGTTIEIKKRRRTTFNFGWPDMFSAWKKDKRRVEKKLNHYLTTTRSVTCIILVNAPLHEL
jgi:hypothetical protein